jgi:hypothetical protein
VALVVDRGAIAMRPPGVVSVGLHALGMENLGWCSFSGRAGQCILLWRDHLLTLPRQQPCSGAVPCGNRCANWASKKCLDTHCCCCNPHDLGAASARLARRSPPARRLIDSAAAPRRPAAVVRIRRSS